MTKTQPEPRRRVALTISIQGDTWDDLHEALSALAEDLGHDRVGRVSMACGGMTYGWSVTGSCDPSITHDSYFEGLDRYLDRVDDPIREE